MNVFILIFIVIISWTLLSFLKKIPLGKYSAVEFYCIEYFFYLIPIMIYLIYLYHTTKFSFLQKIDAHDLKYFLLIIFIGTVGGLVFTQLLKEENVTYVIPSVHSAEIALTAVIGYFIFKENMSNYEILGVIFIVIGLLCMSKKKLSNE